MAQTNTRNKNTAVTHEGAPALAPRTAMHELRRAVSACFLWEDQFYEDGISIADRIRDLSNQAPANEVSALAIEARTRMNLRHVSLWLTLGLFGRKEKVPGFSDTVASVIRRADEMGEMISMYWKDGKRPLPASMKRGIAQAFGKFDAYQLAKYDRKVAIRLRDVLRLTHPKPSNEEQSLVWKGVIDGTIESADTWEVALSGGADKKETFERLIRENRLGYFALIRNLRKMDEVGVDDALVNESILARKGAHNILPFRYVAAARAAPKHEPSLDKALLACVDEMPKLLGKTVILVDVSGSMMAGLSGKSDMTRADAAAALASVINCENLRVFTFDTSVRETPPRRGLAGVDAIRNQVGGGTDIGRAVDKANTLDYDRLIVITDEQSHTSVGGPKPGSKGYMINVASYTNGVGFGAWTRIDGFSENVIRYIVESERLDAMQIE